MINNERIKNIAAQIVRRLNHEGLIAYESNYSSLDSFMNDEEDFQGQAEDNLIYEIVIEIITAWADEEDE